MPIAGSNHRIRGPSHRSVAVTAAWTVRWDDRFRAAVAGSYSRRVRPAALITAEALRHLGLAEGSEHTSQTIKLVPNCIHTIVILDTPGQLKIDDLLDSAGATEMPTGGVETGLGGTAPRPGSPAAPWLVALGAGGLFTLAGGLVIWRARRRPLHAR